jgi:tRNA-Thr(GGU) m(6)t(6)A37 methyltransferase TsaA
MNTKIEIIDFSPIGVIHTPHKESAETPIQPVFAQGIQGTVEIYPEFVEGLEDIEDFSHIILLYYFNQSSKTMLKVKPYLQDKLRGVFATRAPHRPNKIGMSVVTLLKIEENMVYVEDVDMLDGTPLLDIKPYIKRFDSRSDIRSGWQDDVLEEHAQVRGKRDYKKKEE